jgi:hypothetical protein
MMTTLLTAFASAEAQPGGLGNGPAPIEERA